MKLIYIKKTIQTNLNVEAMQFYEVENFHNNNKHNSNAKQ